MQRRTKLGLPQAQEMVGLKNLIQVIARIGLDSKQAAIVIQMLRDNPRLLMCKEGRDLCETANIAIAGSYWEGLINSNDKLLMGMT